MPSLSLSVSEGGHSGSDPGDRSSPSPVPAPPTSSFDFSLKRFTCREYFIFHDYEVIVLEYTTDVLYVAGEGAGLSPKTRRRRTLAFRMMVPGNCKHAALDTQSDRPQNGQPIIVWPIFGIRHRQMHPDAVSPKLKTSRCPQRTNQSGKLQLEP